MLRFTECIPWVLESWLCLRNEATFAEQPGKCHFMQQVDWA